MRARAFSVVVTVVVLAGRLCLDAHAASGPTSPRQQGHSLTVVGCVTQTAGGAFELSNATLASTTRRSGGSNSAKASTPIGGAATESDRPRTGGTTTPKGSTPISVTPVRLTSPTSGSNSPKASTPVRRSETAALVLNGQDSDMSIYAGRTVEVRGALSPQRVLRVEAIRLVTASCTP